VPERILIYKYGGLLLLCVKYIPSGILAMRMDVAMVFYILNQKLAAIEAISLLAGFLFEKWPLIKLSAR
jgi:hypothetical protein